jgi:hypothetical protein
LLFAITISGVKQKYIQKVFADYLVLVYKVPGKKVWKLKKGIKWGKYKKHIK